MALSSVSNRVGHKRDTAINAYILHCGILPVAIKVGPIPPPHLENILETFPGKSNLQQLYTLRELGTLLTFGTLITSVSFLSFRHAGKYRVYLF